MSVIVQEQMALSSFDRSLFVFCNKRCTQLKVLYWDVTGFALWQKRLEKAKFKWPRQHSEATLSVKHEQWVWLLRGFDIQKIKPHEALFFETLN